MILTLKKSKVEPVKPHLCMSEHLNFQRSRKLMHQLLFFLDIFSWHEGLQKKKKSLIQYIKPEPCSSNSQPCKHTSLYGPNVCADLATGALLYYNYDKSATKHISWFLLLINELALITYWNRFVQHFTAATKQWEMLRIIMGSFCRKSRMDVNLFFFLSFHK